jgi:hypothetical protein
MSSCNTDLDGVGRPSYMWEATEESDAFEGTERRLCGGVGRGDTAAKKSSVRERPDELAGGGGGVALVAKNESVLDGGVTREDSDASETCASSGVSTEDTLSVRDDMELFERTERRLGAGVGRENGAEKKSVVRERVLEL